MTRYRAEGELGLLDRSSAPLTVANRTCERRVGAILFTDDGERRLMVAHLRYDDTFVKRDGAWLFAERNPYVDWTETRSGQP